MMIYREGTIFIQCGGSGSVGSVPMFFWPPGSESISQRYKIWIRILLSLSKNSKKNLDSYCFVTFFDFLSLKNDVNVVPSKSNKQKNF
jgi:hypothetical protein